MYDLVYLPLVFAVGVVISYQDIKRGVIRNKMLSLLMLLFTFYFFLNMNELTTVMDKFLLNMLYTLIISVGLWVFGFWPAGDAKLFFVLTSILTASVVQASTSLLSDILVNTFVPLFFFYFFAVIVRSKKKSTMESLRKAFSPYMVTLIVITYIGIAWFISLPLTLLGINNIIAYMVILFAVVEIFYRVSKINLEYLFVGAAVLRLVIDYGNVYTMSFLFNMTATIFIFIVFRFFFLDLAFKANTITINISELHPGMRLAEGILKKKDGGHEKRRILHFTIYDVLRFKLTDKFVHSISDEGLNKEDVKRIKSLHSSNKLGFNTINIHISIPFAAFILFGFFLTILSNGNFINFIKAII